MGGEHEHSSRWLRCCRAREPKPPGMRRTAVRRPPPSGSAAPHHSGVETRSDAAVIEASLADPALFATLFDRHAAVIHRYLARRAGRDAADDLLAESFVAAFSTRARYDRRRADARPWLYGIASNMLARHRRSELRTLRIAGAVGPAGPFDSHEEAVVVDALAEAMRPELSVLLEGLSAGERDVLLLIAWEQLRYDEVALALGIPIGTVRSRLHRARSQLKLALGQLAARDDVEEVLNR